MVREYIGARYVPKFMGTYDGTTSYEALCVVDNGMGTSYISKIPTPPGTPLTNTTYWAVYGATSGAIINLQNQIDDLREDVDDLELLHKNVILYVGDSFMYGPSHLTTALNNVLTPDNSYNVSHGATGFVRDTDGASFPHQLDYAASDDNIPNDSITDIIICGGINDDSATTQTQYESAIATMISRRNTSFPNARMWFVPMTWGTSHLTLDDQRKYTKIYNACIVKGVATMPYAYTILMGLDSAIYMLPGDPTHPSDEGCKLIAGHIADWIHGGESNIDRYEVSNITTVNSESVAQTLVQRDGFLYIKLFFYSRDNTYLANTKICDLDPRINLSSGLKLPMNIVVTAGTYAGQLYVKDGGLYATEDFGYCDATATLLIPSVYIY